MKTRIKTVIVVLALSAPVWVTCAQEDGGPPPGEPPLRREGLRGFTLPGGPDVQPPHRSRGGTAHFDRQGQRPPPPLVGALDANGDGVIDDVEIANASVALKRLDRNGDGKLTMEELRPPHTGGMGEPAGPVGRESAHAERPGQPPELRRPRGPEELGPRGFRRQGPPPNDQLPPSLGDRPPTQPE